MYKGFCHTCQEFLETPNKFCKKCGMMLEILQTILSAESATNTVNSNTYVENQQPHFSNSQQDSTFVSNSQNNNFQENQFGTVNNYPQPINSGYSQNQPNFQRDNFQAKKYSQDNQVFAESDGSVVMKTAIKFFVVVICLIGLGFGVNYAKDYFAAMPQQTIDNIMASKNNIVGNNNQGIQKTVNQTPWCWCWFRKNPTAEEVFEKYESAANLVGKDVVSQTITIVGHANFIPVDINSSKNESIQKFNFAIELYMKAPNKVLVKMNMTFKRNYTILNDFMNPVVSDEQKKMMDSFNAKIITGTSGDGRWEIKNITANGQTKKEETENEKNDFDKFTNKTDHLTMTFSRQQYQNIEFIGIDNVENRKTYLVKGVKPSGDIELLYFDIETGLVNKYFSKDNEVYIDSYNEYQGVKMPSMIRQRMYDLYFSLHISDIKQNDQFDDSIFLRSSY